MRLAAVDVGTNSIHTVIVEVEGDLSVKIVDSTKETVHLGRGLDAKENLTARAMTDALGALKRAQVLCASHGVEHILAVATSAIREAPNGLEFIRLAERRVGTELRVISGLEEARLIYLAVRESVHFARTPFLGMDIGGGSVELFCGDRSELLAAESLKLGVLRLADRFPLSDPPAKGEIAALEGHVERGLEGLDDFAATCAGATAVGTSGTFLQVCRLALDDNAGGKGASLHQQVVDADSLREVCARIVRASAKERLATRGLDRTRLHTIVPGAVVLRALLDRFSLREVTACEYALREGVLYDYVAQNRAGLTDERAFPDIRHRSVLALARRCNWKEPHARHVAALSLLIFDQLAPRLGWPAEERELLEYAALLHDIGMLISVPKHHLHSEYLIRHGDLLGFTPREITVLGSIVRYHRRAEPSKRHASYRALSKPDRRTVARLAAILRVVEGLDRTQFGLIRSVHCEVAEGRCVMTALPAGDAELEHASAVERSGPLSKALGMEVTIQLGPVELACAAPDADGVAPTERELVAASTGRAR
jgi:exopolyphosphatase/guanosine-5'-triphosphate,3'-diphosphate pyrophosphatase